MDDMNAALGSILNNPQAMQQIMSLASQLGLGGPPAENTGGGAAMPAAAPPPSYAPPPPAAPPPQQPFSPPPAAPEAANPLGALAGLDLNALGKITQVMGGLNTRDQNVELLLALKPHFGEKRQKKVDDAIRIMQLVKMLPLLKETGIFGSLLGGDT